MAERVIKEEWYNDIYTQISMVGDRVESRTIYYNDGSYTITTYPIQCESYGGNFVYKDDKICRKDIKHILDDAPKINDRFRDIKMMQQKNMRIYRK